jgi:ankyrin repeat protein
MLGNKITIYLVFFFYYVLVKKIIETFYPDISSSIKTFILLILPFLIKYLYNFLKNYLYFSKEEREIYRLYRDLKEDDFINHIKKHYSDKIKHLETLKCPTGENILSWAIHEDKYELVKELLKLGYNVDVKNHKNNERPIFRAIHWNKVETLKLLLKYKPNLYEKNSHKLTPIDLAIYRGKDVIVDLLMKEGVEYSFNHYEKSTSSLKLILKWKDIKDNVKKVIATHIGNVLLI